MKTETKERITNQNARITNENVQHIGECIALSAIKKMMRFAHHPRSLDKLYAGLVEDIYGNRGYNAAFGDGYGLASMLICFLLQAGPDEGQGLSVCDRETTMPAHIQNSYELKRKNVRLMITI